VLDQQRAGVEWQDVYGTENVGTRQNHTREIVVRFLSISRRTFIIKMAHQERRDGMARQVGKCVYNVAMTNIQSVQRLNFKTSLSQNDWTDEGAVSERPRRTASAAAAAAELTPLSSRNERATDRTKDDHTSSVGVANGPSRNLRRRG